MSTTFVKVTELKRFISDCLRKVGVNETYANTTAEVFVYFDTVGVNYRGVGDLGKLLNEINNGVVKANAVPRINKELDSTVWVTGNSGLGYVVADFCMRIAIEKAKRSGLCIVTATNSSNFGGAGYYAYLASKSNLIGLAFSNSSCNTIVPGATKAGTGSNPIAIAAPGKEKETFLLDMASTTVSEAKLRSAHEVQNNWALDENKRPTAKAEKAAYLQPLGSGQEREYKGFGLALMVDVLCGVLSGSNFGPFIGRRSSRTYPANIGHCFIVLNPACFAPGFESRLTDIIRNLRQLPPIASGTPVIVPGDGRADRAKSVMDQGGIELTEDQIKKCNEISTALRVKPLTTFKK